MSTSIAGGDFARNPPWTVGTGAFVLGAAAYLAAGAVVAVVHSLSPLTRGWWLVAFLSLVGSVSQLLLGLGLVALRRRKSAPRGLRRTAWTELVLWNSGTAVVAIADLASSLEGVIGGGMLLWAALVLFAADLRALSEWSPAPPRRWIRTYSVLLAFLALSVVVGILLA